VYRLVHGSPPPGIALEFALIPTIDLPRVLQRVSPNNAHIAANYFNGVVDWFAVAMLVFWAVVPVGVGYLRFRRQEVTA
jgi:ABC-type transport system involved in multi-copper enzyme maturation permease subunit